MSCNCKSYPTLKYQRIADYALTPAKANKTDSGIDIYSPIHFIIPPHESVKIKTGLRFEIPTGWDLTVDNRSSIATKKGCIRGAGVIDNDYRGELIIHLINTTDQHQEFDKFEKIAQLVMREVWQGDLVEVDDIGIDTNRGEGGFGSTGT